MANNQNDDLLQEIKNENKRLDNFINDIEAKIKKTDRKLAKAIINSDIKTIKQYKDILQNKKSN